VVYVTYEFAPQAPFPTGLEQVIAVYRALRDSTHAHRLGFVAAPLVLVGLSAGGNLAVASVIAPLIKGLRAQGDVNGSGADGTDCT
jgi:acetyl esterase/lipase